MLWWQCSSAGQHDAHACTRDQFMSCCDVSSILRLPYVALSASKREPPKESQVIAKSHHAHQSCCCPAQGRRCCQQGGLCQLYRAGGLRASAFVGLPAAAATGDARPLLLSGCLGLAASACLPWFCCCSVSGWYCILHAWQGAASMCRSHSTSPAGQLSSACILHYCGSSSPDKQICWGSNQAVKPNATATPGSHQLGLHLQFSRLLSLAGDVHPGVLPHCHLWTLIAVPPCSLQR